MNKLSAYSLTLVSSINLIFAHTDEIEEFTGGIFPYEYFIHGYYLYGLSVIALWCLILWGIYSLTIMVLGRHIK